METATIQTIQDVEKDLTLPRKRKYTSKACSSCRKLKIRCRELTTGIRSSCEHCFKLGKACTWPEEDARKYGRLSTSRRISDSSFNTNMTSGQDPSSAARSSAVPFAYDLQDDQHEIERSSVNQASHHASSPQRSEAPHTVLQYYRYLGSTAIAPGYKKVSLKIANDDTSGNDLSNDFTASPQHFEASLFESSSNLPRSKLLPPLLDAFFEYYGSNFCFLNRQQLESLIQTNEISSFLLCSIAALSARFCDPKIFMPYFSPLTHGQQRERWQYSLPFLSQAKKLLLPLLSIPSCDLVAGLLFLALAEFGDNNEAGQ